MKATLIKNVNVYINNEFSEGSPKSILLKNGLISELGLNEEAVGPDVEVIDGRGTFVLPGFIDCHNHLSLDSELPNYLMRMNNSEKELAIIAAKTLVKDLKSGVTTSRCLGDRFFIDSFCKQAITDGLIEGPELKVSGIGMRASHGSGFVGLPFDGDQLLNAIRENLKNKVDWIKFYATGIAPVNGYIQSFYSEKEIATIIDEAHRSGTPVTSHCIGGEGLKTSVRLGIDCLEHVYFIKEDEIDLMIKQGTSVCLTPSEFFMDKEHTPQAVKEIFKVQRPTVRKSMELIVNSGIPFVIGTDGFHGGLYKEAQYLSEFGASNQQIINGLTVNAAKLLGISSSKGEIKEGMQADLVMLQGNPLEDIGALQKVKQVFKKGVAVN